jgi:hypothetical protein
MAGRNIVAEAVGAASHDRAVKLSGPERRSSMCACSIGCIDISIDIEERYVRTCNAHSESPANRQPAKGYGFEIVIHRDRVSVPSSVNESVGRGTKWRCGSHEGRFGGIGNG